MKVKERVRTEDHGWKTKDQRPRSKVKERVRTEDQGLKTKEHGQKLQGPNELETRYSLVFGHFLWSLVFGLWSFGLWSLVIDVGHWSLVSYIRTFHCKKLALYG